jgi:hypothetical protein
LATVVTLRWVPADLKEIHSNRHNGLVSRRKLSRLRISGACAWMCFAQRWTSKPEEATSSLVGWALPNPDRDDQAVRTLLAAGCAPCRRLDAIPDACRRNPSRQWDRRRSVRARRTSPNPQLLGPAHELIIVGWVADFSRRRWPVIMRDTGRIT